MFPSLEPAFPAFEFKYRMQLFVSRSRAEWLAFPAGEIFFSAVHGRGRRLNRFRGSGAIQARPSLIAVISEGVRISDASRFMQWSHSTLPVTSGQCWSLVLPTGVLAASPERWARSRNGRVAVASSPLRAH